MDEFKKIKEEELEDENFDIHKKLVDRVEVFFSGNCADMEMCQIDSLLDCESPIEQLLSLELDLINLRNLSLYNDDIDVLDIIKQADIKVGSNVYRVDFLIPVKYKKTIINYVVECDGHNFHSSKSQIKNDNNRQRNLQANGYEIVRFSGSELYENPYMCAVQLLNIIKSKAKKL